MNNVSSSNTLKIEDYENFIKSNFPSQNIKTTFKRIGLLLKAGLWLDSTEIMNQLRGKIVMLTKDLNKKNISEINTIKDELQKISRICVKLQPSVSLHHEKKKQLEKLKINLHFSENILDIKLERLPKNNFHSQNTLPLIGKEVIEPPKKLESKNVKLIKYKISLAYTILSNLKNENRWFNTIIEDKLTLGAIPLRNKNHLEEIPKHGVNAILTALEDFEIQTKTFFSKPISGKEWTELKLDYKWIDTPDFLPISLEKINDGVEWLHDCISNDKHVYVHCKAGRGRSATLVIAYLLKYGNNGFKFNKVEEAISFVKAKRPVIHMNPQQKQALYDYFVSDYRKL